MNPEVEYWNRAAKKTAKGQDFDLLLAEQYQNAYINLVTRWADTNKSQTILKTDLFAEAIHPLRSFLWGLLKANHHVVGIDISSEITSLARHRTAQYAPDSLAQYINSDVRCLPFGNNSFDLIVSDSTLDHFHYSHEIITALSELSRVLKPGGTLIITMDNKGNITDPLMRLWNTLGWSRVFLGKSYSIKELNQALAKVGLQVVDNTAIIHNPRFFVREIVTRIRKVEPNRFNGCINRCLASFDRLERKRTRYLTAQFIAAKAVKPS
jgi:ubiquinone/menaquinone biosynthesis C-methylase UbiE